MARPVKNEKLQRVVLYLPEDLKNKIESCDKTDLMICFNGFFGLDDKTIINGQVANQVAKLEPKKAKPPVQKTPNMCNTFFK